MSCQSERPQGGVKISDDALSKTARLEEKKPAHVFGSEHFFEMAFLSINPDLQSHYRPLASGMRYKSAYQIHDLSWLFGGQNS